LAGEFQFYREIYDFLGPVFDRLKFDNKRSYTPYQKDHQKSLSNDSIKNPCTEDNNFGKNEVKSGEPQI
jgi:hypothetical protein